MINLKDHVIQFSPGEIIYITNMDSTSVKQIKIRSCHLEIHKNGLELQYEGECGTFAQEGDVFETANEAFKAMGV